MQSDKLVPLVFVALAAAILGWESMAAQQPGARDGQSGDDLELATTVADGFTIASVGDVIIAYPQSQNAAPAFQNVVRLIRDADVATGNYEGNIIDGRTFAGSGPGGFAGTPDVAADLKTMGFDLVARSNNHAGEYGYEGLLETNRHLDEAGVVYAGSGEKYASAIAPRFVSTPKGRIGMVATAASFPRNMRAEPGRGEWPGRGGAGRGERAPDNALFHGPDGALAGRADDTCGVPERARFLPAGERVGVGNRHSRPAFSQSARRDRAVLHVRRQPAGHERSRRVGA